MLRQLGHILAEMWRRVPRLRRYEWGWLLKGARKFPYVMAERGEYAGPGWTVSCFPGCAVASFGKWVLRMAWRQPCYGD